MSINQSTCQERVNVLYLIWSLGLGGAEQIVIQTAIGLNRQRFVPYICCLNDEGPFAYQAKSQGIPVISLYKRRGLDISVIPKLLRVIRDNHIGLIHAHLWGANFWGRIAAIMSGVPVVVTEHNVDVWKKWYHKAADRLLAVGTQKICVVSEQVKEFYMKSVGISASRLEVVYNSIAPDPPPLDAAEIKNIRQGFGIHNGTPVLVNMGRLVEAKANHIFIAKSFIKMYDFFCCFYAILVFNSQFNCKTHDTPPLNELILL